MMTTREEYENDIHGEYRDEEECDCGGWRWFNRTANRWMCNNPECEYT
jgi:hypothetical protein